ncbi:aldo/keto reductase [Alkalicoccus luteus]|uniref:Aldo/keto reductase n=1 Tax=Alkalicoccus luteus TaxID=1237094 RepID=A0A969TVN2_9BACI|nr:aldo/keto reductase [Alkalicoccus luteus]NJP36534.1 aldo/keto reductase [Alkalicoccus luteus]
MEFVTLNNGTRMPQLGFGVWQVPDDEAEAAVTNALKAGYRSIDTAMIYQNETGVGKALAKTSIPREELFITTKVWNADQGYENTMNAFEASLDRLGLDYVDLYLIHWPTPEFDEYVDTYKALEALYESGKVKAIGVCNFDIDHLERLKQECSVTPVLNQVECHPFLAQEELRNYCDTNDIYVEAWSPLMQGGEVLNHPVVQNIAEDHQKTGAQVILRWHLQRGNIVIPKSVTPSRIKENIDVFDFELTDDELEIINNLDRGIRKGPKPAEMNKR